MTLSPLHPHAWHSSQGCNKVPGSVACQDALSLGRPCPPTSLLRVRNQLTQGCREPGLGSLERPRNDLRVKRNKMLLFFITLCFTLDDVSDVHNYKDKGSELVVKSGRDDERGGL